MKLVRYVFLVLINLLLIFQVSFARTSFELKTNLNFVHDSTISEGELESFSLIDDESIHLLVGTTENEKIYINIAKIQDEELRSKFLEKAISVDGINNYTNRQIVSFQKKIEADNRIQITIKFEIQKNNEKWFELNNYIVTPSGSAFASVLYPFSTRQARQKDIEKSMDRFQFLESDKTTVFQRIQEKMRSILENGTNELVAFSGLLVEESWAEDAIKNLKGCDAKKYILKGKYTTKPGSALFNFAKITADIKKEVMAETLKEVKAVNVDQSPIKKDESDGQKNAKLDCLMNFYKEAKQNATEYWSKRVIEDKCKVSEEGNIDCPNATMKEMKKSFDYLDNVDRSLQKFLEGEEELKIACVDKAREEKELDLLKSMNATAMQTVCCQGEGEEKGTLFQLMEDEEEGFKKLAKRTQIEMCLQKTKDADGTRNGIAECAENAFKGVGKLVGDTIKTMSSLFDWETVKALGRFALHPLDTGKELLEAMGESIGKDFDAVTNCMSSHEKNQYICRKFPVVLATLFSPMGIRYVAKLIVEKASKSAYLQAIAAATKGSPAYQKVKGTVEKIAEKSKHLASKALKYKVIKFSVNVLNYVRRGLNKDISTPIKEMVAKKARAAILAGALLVKEVPEKILTRNKDAVVVVAQQEAGTVVANEVVQETANQIKDKAKEQVQEQALAQTAQVSTQSVTQTTAQTTQASSNLGISSSAKNLSYTQSQIDFLKDIEVFKNKKLEALKKLNVVDVKKLNPEQRKTFKQEIKTFQQEILSKAEKLSDEDRITLAKVISGKEKLLDENKIVEAHLVGKDSGRGYGTLTTEDVLKKNRLLEEAGVDDSEARRLIMESGITGNLPEQKLTLLGQDARFSPEVRPLFEAPAITPSVPHSSPSTPSVNVSHPIQLVHNGQPITANSLRPPQLTQEEISKHLKGLENFEQSNTAKPHVELEKPNAPKDAIHAENTVLDEKKLQTEMAFGEYKVLKNAEKDLKLTQKLEHAMDVALKKGIETPEGLAARRRLSELFEDESSIPDSINKEMLLKEIAEYRAKSFAENKTLFHKNEHAETSQIAPGYKDIDRLLNGHKKINIEASAGKTSNKDFLDDLVLKKLREKYSDEAHVAELIERADKEVFIRAQSEAQKIERDLNLSNSISANGSLKILNAMKAKIEGLHLTPEVKDQIAKQLDDKFSLTSKVEQHKAALEQASRHFKDGNFKNKMSARNEGEQGRALNLRDQSDVENLTSQLRRGPHELSNEEVVRIKELEKAIQEKRNYKNPSLSDSGIHPEDEIRANQFEIALKEARERNLQKIKNDQAGLAEKQGRNLITRETNHGVIKDFHGNPQAARITNTQSVTKSELELQQNLAREMSINFSRPEIIKYNPVFKKNELDQVIGKINRSGINLNGDLIKKLNQASMVDNVDLKVLNVQKIELEDFLKQARELRKKLDSSSASNSLNIDVHTIEKLDRLEASVRYHLKNFIGNEL